MKINLAENMRRFGTKNLNETAIRNINALIYEQVQPVPKTPEEAEQQITTKLTELEVAEALVNRAAAAAKAEAKIKANTEKEKSITYIQSEIVKYTNLLKNPNIDRRTKRLYNKQLRLLLDKINALNDVSSTNSMSDDERTPDVKFKSWVEATKDIVATMLGVIGLFSAHAELQKLKFPDDRQQQ